MLIIKYKPCLCRFHFLTFVLVKKVAIIGFGNIGKALAFRLLEDQYHVDHICIIDPDETIEGARLDIEDAAILHNCDFSLNDAQEFQQCDIIFHCAGASVPKTGNRLEIAAENVLITKQIFESYHPKEQARIIVVTNPVDIISFYSWKYSDLPANQVMGTGTLLDTMRLNRLLKRKGYQSCNGIVLGEHGSSMFISKTLSQLENEPLSAHMSNEEVLALTDEVSQSAKRIKMTQSATIYGVVEAALCLYLALGSEKEIKLPASTLVDEDFTKSETAIFISQLCSVSEKGISPATITLEKDDQEAYERSIQVVTDCMNNI